MHPSLSASQIHGKTKFLTQAIDQCASAIAIKEFHPTDVTREVPLINEICEHRWEEAWRAYVHGNPDGKKTCDEIWRNNNIPEAQRREQDLAKGADIDDAIIPVEAL